jgi:hypothetical protein
MCKLYNHIYIIFLENQNMICENLLKIFLFPELLGLAPLYPGTGELLAHM